ncbi:nucleotide exchange factor GrpE [Candidatus Omnitrophota bacterium]
MFSKDKDKEKPENLKLKKEDKDSKKVPEKFEDKYHDCYDKLLRLQAEFDNAKKRMQRQQQEFIKYANEEIILELLGIFDDLERSVDARETNHQDPQAFLKGIEMILSHLYEMLKKHGVKPIEAKGKIFDPNQHEALMQSENNDYPENTVLEELQKGYLLEDRVIRTAKVKVSKNKEEDKKDAEDIGTKENQNGG